MQVFATSKATALGGALNQLTCLFPKSRQAVRIMKLTTIFLLAACLQLSAKGVSQTVSITVKDAPLLTVLKEIKKQTGYFYLADNEWLQKAKNVTISAVNWPLAKVLDECFKGQPLTYNIEGKVINIVPREEKGKTVSVVNDVPPIDVRGRVVNENGEPIQGVTVAVKRKNKSTITDANGLFRIKDLDESDILMFTHVGRESLEMGLAGKSELLITLKTRISSLDEVKIIGYGTTTQRLATGNVERVSSELIGQQIITNPLQALEGQVAGLQITQANGLPGAPINVQIRGQNSIAASNNPLYVIDGVPFTSTPIEILGGPNGNGSSILGSPMNSISPADIESIEILKDADATAIYGSRGSNGVILITTKRNKSGKSKFDFNINKGVGRVTVLPQMLNTEQYLQVRKDAFINSNLTPTVSNAPDLKSWDTTDYTNWQQWYLGGKATLMDVTASYSGGSDQTTFLLGGSYHDESTILPGSTDYKRGSGHLFLGHTSKNKKIDLATNIFYVADKNLLSGTVNGELIDIVRSIPNYPTYNNSDMLNWTGSQTNRIAELLSYSKRRTDNFNSNVTLKYTIFPGFNVKTNLGYNKIEVVQINGFPSTSKNPTTNPTGSSQFANQYIKTYLFEPQVAYNANVGGGSLDILLGATLQNNETNGQFIYMSNYTNDLLIESLNYGSVLFTGGNTTQYKYSSEFGRLTYNYKNRYLINGNVRRDGSSRFGPSKQFGNFGSIGAAWLFSDENFMKNALRWITYGKLRGSYGTAGNDGISDYGYLSLYTNTTNYGTTTAIVPSQIANPNYQWEVNKKLELALEIGLFNERILLTSSWYRNRSNNQLVGYSLPSITGFATYTANLPAVVQNSGYEFELSTINIKKKDISWTTSLNLSIPKNKLLDFPNISATSYANTYVVGKPLSIIQRYHFVGVDPQTGMTVIDDVNQDGLYTSKSSFNSQGGDYVIAGKLTPDWFGGLNNKFSYKGIEVSILIQFMKQQGYNVYSYSGSAFGQLFNTYSSYLDYWKKPGSQANIPAPFATSNTSLTNFRNSDVGVSDASFLRLKNIYAAYNLPIKWLKSVKANSFQIFASGQNIYTWTRYKGYDPETSNNPTPMVPPIKSFMAGIKFSF